MPLILELLHLGIFETNVFINCENCHFISNQDSELFLLGGDSHKKKKKHSDDYYYRGRFAYMMS